MTDFFSLFEEQRRPWLEPEGLKKKFLTLSARYHPDRLHNASEAEKQAGQTRYAEFNAGYNCLREPRHRLGHLLELERGANPKNVHQVPSDLMNVFIEVSQLCREADSFVAKKEAVSSPLLKVQLFETGQTLAENLMQLQRQLVSWLEKIAQLLKEMDEQWLQNSDFTRRQTMLKELEDHYCLLSYLNRWQVQIQERLVRLTL